MKQTLLFDVGPKPKRTCPTCGGPIRAGRCRPCQKDTPAVGGGAWRRWTQGIARVVLRRCEAAGYDRLGPATWNALLSDTPVPPETAPLVADIARLPFSVKRYQRTVDLGVTRSQLEAHLVRQGFPNGTAHGWVADNIAARAAELIWAQRDRVAAGEVFERRHDAELVEQAVCEHEVRTALRAKGLRGPTLERTVTEETARRMESVWGSYGRPSDEYPREMRLEGLGARVAVPVRIEVDDDALAEAAEMEAAEAPRRGRAG